jgi:outer membrane protein assembly factor BamB
MKTSKQFRGWLSRRGALALFIMLVALIWIFQIWLERHQPRISHVLGTSTQHVDVLWSNQEIFTQVTSNEDGAIYAMPITRGNFRAIDIHDGSTTWEVDLPLEKGGGAAGMLATQNKIFIVTSIFVDAYEATTGELKWSTKLGDGHVSVIPQLDSNILRIYYGDKLIELEPETGKILTMIPKDAIVWVSDNIILQVSPANQLIALDKQSSEVLWTNNRLFYLDERHEPLDIGRNSLLVGFTRGVCALNLENGEYYWCHPEIYISDVAIDYQSQLGYAMREELVLLTIDLQTGDVLGETSFLSSQPIDEQNGSMSSITFSDGILVVSFSDSGQTFGLSLNQSSQIQVPGSTP